MPIRLHITAEGQTEERFVKDVLAPYLGERGVWVDARCVLTGRNNRLRMEVIPDERADALDFFQQGKFGRTRDLRSTITHIRLSGMQSHPCFHCRRQKWLGYS